MAEMHFNVLSVLLYKMKMVTCTKGSEYKKLVIHRRVKMDVVVFFCNNFVARLSVKKQGVILNTRLAVWGRVTAPVWQCYINNTDVGVEWCGRVPQLGPIICHTEEVFVGAGLHFKHLFILALITRFNLREDIVVCVCKGLKCNAEVPLRKPVSLTKHCFFASSVGFSKAPR